MSTFSIRLKELRKQHRETQEEISDFLGIQRTTFSGYERGIILLPYEKMQMISEHYHVSLDYLTGKSNRRDYSITNSDNIPDVYEQLMLISNELLSDTTVVKCKGKIIDNDEKKTIELFIENVSKYIDAMMRGKE